MAGTIIQIKRTANVTAPSVSELEEAELAYAQDTSADGAGAILYIESVNANASPSIHKVGGKYYTDIVDAATSNNTAGKLVKRDSSGDFRAGNITAALYGQANSAVIANTANTLTTARTITLGGDLTGNVSFNGSQDVTITATIAADSVALGTDTTGYFVGNITANTGISLSGTAGENANIVVGLATSGVTAGLYGNATSIPAVTVDVYGRITSVSSNNVDLSNLGTPTTLTLTNATGLPVSTGISGLGSNVATFLGQTPTSANLAALIFDETGTGNLVFSTSPVLVTPNLGTPSAITLTSATGLPLSTGITGLGDFQANLLASNAYTSVAAGTYGNVSYAPVVTVDVYGRVSNIYTVAINTGNANSGVITSFTRTGNTFTINENGTNFSANISVANIPVGTATLGNLVSNAVVLTVDSTMANSIAQLNQVLGRLVPAAPTAFPTSSLTMSSSTTSARMAGGFTQFYNSTANTSVAPGTTVATLRSAPYLTSTIQDSGPGDSGTLSLYLNDALAGSRAFASGSDNGTYGGNLVIADNVDYATKTGAAAGFWESFDAYGQGTAKTGWNSVYITHSGAGTTNTLTWYYDNSNPSAPTFANKTLTEASNTRIFSSTVPHYTSATSFTLAAYVNNLSGNTYPTSDTFITSTAGGAFQAPATLTYSAAGVSTPLTQNLYVASGNVAISTTSSITTGFGSSAGGPSLTSTNGYNSSGASTFTVTGTPTILYKTGTASSMEETTLTFGSAIGTGSGLAARIVNPGSTDNPAYSSNTTFNSQSGTLQTYDATIVAAVLKHDQVNYSTGYIPVGPDLSSGRSGSQYFTFKFARTSVSKFNIKFTGTIAGLWVALPGSTIDTYSSLNGWLDMSIAYGGAGVPGANAGGNGSNGCALGGVVTLNSSVSAHSKTCTFGTVSSSDTATNEIYVRIKLTSGQSVTALSLETASN